MSDKERVANHAVKMVKQGMVVGLGTGSTANYFIEALAYKVKQESLQVTTVASSLISSIKAQSLGLSVVAMEQIKQLDLYVDGADEVTVDNILLKGQGADLVKEKLLAKCSRQFIVLIDQSKQVARIGEKFAIPIEVMPFAWQMVKQQLEGLGAAGDLRKNKENGGIAVSSHGSVILDMVFEPALHSKEIDTLLNNMPGVVEHGVFCDLADLVLYVEEGAVREKLR